MLETTTAKSSLLRQSTAFALDIGHSLTGRIRRAEGGLLAVNASIALAAAGTPARVLSQIFVSGALLTLLYLHNDLVDGATDLVNPKKDVQRVERLLRRRSLLASLLPLLLVLTACAAYLLLGRASLLALLGLALVNTSYCHLFKGRPVLDVAIVGAGGALFILVPGVPVDLGVVLLVATFTAASHVFQVLADRPADVRNRVRTTAVASTRLASALLVACCLIGAVVVGESFGAAFAPLTLLPLLALRVVGSAERAWVLSKLGFGVLWLLLLVTGSVVSG